MLKKVKKSDNKKPDKEKRLKKPENHYTVIARFVVIINSLIMMLTIYKTSLGKDK